ncbi:MAG: DUF4384 domain-containing protein [Acidobacteria bacterium]|nr:DUF4384 domain-containing protein [Acidobacteriota bacterium]
MKLQYLLVLGLCASGAVVCAQTERKLSARELFYTPLPAKQVTAETEKKTEPAKRKTTSTAKRRTETRKDPAGGATIPPDTGRPGDVQAVRTSGGGVPLHSVAQTSGVPLSLRCSILKRTAGDDYDEVDANTVFRSGDRIRVQVEANDDAHLYIVQQGTSKAWDVLFPNAEDQEGDNRVRRNRRIAIPAAARFTFDDQPGTERLFIVLARRPQNDLERLIYDLSGGAKTGPASAPAAAPERSKPMMLAANLKPIDDGVISQLRSTMIARDLVFEKVDEKTAAADRPSEKALYMATPDRGPDARVILELNLKHR